MCATNVVSTLLLKMKVHDVMYQMHHLADTGKFYVPAITGPGTTKRAFLFFMGIDERTGATEEQVKYYSKPVKGLYQGWGNRTVTVEGTRSTSNNWCKRSAIGGNAKKKGWKQMNITHYQILNKEASGKSCFLQLHDMYMEQQQQQQQIDQVLRTRRW